MCVVVCLFVLREGLVKSLSCRACRGSQSAGITGVCHHTWCGALFCFVFWAESYGDTCGFLLYGFFLLVSSLNSKLFGPAV